MIRRSLNVLVPTLAAAALATLTLTAQETGIKNKRPVFAGACKVCPWGRLEKSSKACSAEIHARCATQRTVHPAWAPHPA
jgi:hypothetical protein